MIALLRRRLGPGLSARTFDFLIIAGWFALTRALVLAAAHAAAAHAGHDPCWSAAIRDELHRGAPPGALLEPLVRWDALYYASIARYGYPGAHPWNIYQAAFFPLYPLAIRAAGAVVQDTFASAVALSGLFALGAAFAIAALTRTAGRRRDGLAAALLFLASPGAGFLSFPYTESLSCLLVALGLWAVERDRPWLAAALGALASATRATGIAVLVALAVRLWERRRDAWAAASNALAVPCSAAGLFAYAAFCQVRYGDALYFSHIQRFWGRQMSLLGPFRALVGFHFDPDYYLVTLAALGVAIWMIRRARPTWTASAWMLLLIPLSTGTLKSMIRFQGANVPLFAGAGRLVRGRALTIALGASLLLQLYEVARYAAGFANN